MTLPFERARAVRHTEQFLKDLVSPSKTPRVPKYIRDQAYSLLRHYPTLSDLETVQQCWKDDIISEPPFMTDDPFFGKLK